MMRKNNTLLTDDLKENPGYDEKIHGRIVMKMTKNIKYLYQKYLNEDFNEQEFQNFKTLLLRKDNSKVVKKELELFP